MIIIIIIINNNIQKIKIIKMMMKIYIKFDLITSYFSCGFHYPVKEYKELIQRHSHENTRIILDLRCSTKSRTVVLEDDIEIVNVLINRTKSVMAEIKFKN